MFRPVRLIVLLGAAFLAGLLTERYNAAETCRAAGGEIDKGVCKGVP